MSIYVQSRQGKSQGDYDYIGIKKDSIENWEDGFRTDGKSGNFEWWYFDAHLNDGSTLVTTFATKSPLDPNSNLLPSIVLNFDSPEGIHIDKIFDFPVEKFSSSKEECNVIIGPNFFKGNLKDYFLHIEYERIIIDVKLHGMVPSWRPETGYFFYGEGYEKYFAWLAAIPQGDVEVTLKIDGKTMKYTGIGYHDHNWGNENMSNLMHHWYWGRGKIGDYGVITAYLYKEEIYGYAEYPHFYLAKEGKMLADSSTGQIDFNTEDKFIDEETGKPVYNRLIFNYKDEEQNYKITYIRNQTIMTYKMIDKLPEELKPYATERGAGSAYLRFMGSITLEKIVKGEIVEKIEEPALWELMYFGENR